MYKYEKDSAESKEIIRVVHIMGKLWAGGVEKVVFNYYRQIDKSRIQFDFIYDDDSTVDPPIELIEMGARFYKVPPYQNVYKYMVEVGKIISLNEYHIVHSHINTLSVIPLFVARRKKVPVRIAHSHSVPGGNELKRNILKNFLKMFSKIFSTNYFACSEKAGRWMFGNGTFEEGKVVVLKNAVLSDDFQSDEGALHELKCRYDLNDKFVMGHIGRFTYAKNHEYLLQIFVEVLNLNKDAILLLVGDGELHDFIVENIRRLGITDQVILVGKVNNPELYYKLINVLVVPSVFEGLSLVTIEGQIAGVPVVISEAIPDEAIISNACFRCKLKDEPRKWAEDIMYAATVRPELNDRADEYDIKLQVKFLEEWYLKNYV